MNLGQPRRNTRGRRLQSGARRSVADEVQLLEATKDFAVAVWGNVLVVVWRERTLAHDVLTVRRHFESVKSMHPKGMLLLTLVDAKAPPPNEAARTALVEFFRSGEGCIAAGAVVLEGHSLRTAFVRGVATGLAMMAKLPFPFVPTTMAGAIKLLDSHAKRQGVALNAERIPSVAKQVREKVETHATVLLNCVTAS